MVRTTRTPIPGLPGVVLTADHWVTQQQDKGTTFALAVTRDDCVDFSLDLSASDCDVLGRDGARVLARSRRAARPFSAPPSGLELCGNHRDTARAC